jgi:hypothetical protein
VLLGAERKALAELEVEMGREVEVRAVPGMHQEQFEVIALDSGPPVEFPIPWLGLGQPEREAAPEPEPEPVVVVEPLVAAAPRPRMTQYEDFSPLDLPEDEPAQAVDGQDRFPILPRPEQGEES